MLDMPAAHRIDYDPAINRLTIRVSGFWTPTDVPPFAAALGDAIRRVRETRADFEVLIDSLDFPVQANDVADLLGIGPKAMALTSGRCAIVVASHLNKLQVERTQDHPRIHAFRTMDAALAWLAEG